MKRHLVGRWLFCAAVCLPDSGGWPVRISAHPSISRGSLVITFSICHRMTFVNSLQDWTPTHTSFALCVCLCRGGNVNAWLLLWIFQILSLGHDQSLKVSQTTAERNLPLNPFQAASREQRTAQCLEVASGGACSLEPMLSWLFMLGKQSRNKTPFLLGIVQLRAGGED